MTLRAREKGERFKMILIKDGTIVTLDRKNNIIKGSLVIEDKRISRIGKVKASADIIIDARGKMVIPGMICAHSHMYGAFARGMPLRGTPPKNLLEILENFWWRMDRRLTLRDVRLSAEISLVEMIKSGITSFAEHHSSPYALKNSLDTIAKVVERAGLRGMLSYEVSDRDGPEIAKRGIEENTNFIKNAKENVRGNFGLHASMTLSDETLEKCLKIAKRYDVGFHIHVAESKFDPEDSVKYYGKRTVERLKDKGILNPKTIAAHCVHVDETEIELLRETNVVHNPQSNMNNAVGVAPIPEMLEVGINVGLGTDGFCFDMFREAKVMYILHKLSKRDPRVMSADTVVKVLFGNNSRIVGFDVGSIEVGKLADLVILNYRPPTPLTPENFPWHFIFGMDSSNVQTVIADGNIVMQDREIKTLNEEKITEASKKAARKLWDRFSEDKIEER